MQKRIDVAFAKRVAARVLQKTACGTTSFRSGNNIRDLALRLPWLPETQTAQFKLLTSNIDFQIMHASQLAQIGSWIAIHSSSLIFGNSGPQELASVNYWTNSKCRLNRWITSLKMFEDDLRDENLLHNPWPAIETVIEEVFISEFLTRIWSASVLAHDNYQDSDELFGLAHSVHISHIEASNRAMRVLLTGQAANEKAFERLNQLRRKIARWTDLFLAQIPDLQVAQTFAFDIDRVADFSEENSEMPQLECSRRQQVLMASFAAEVRSFQSRWAANPALNQKISSSLMGCFPADRFDSLGLPKSFGMILLEKTQHDTQLLVDRLLEIDTESVTAVDSPKPHFRSSGLSG